MKRFFGYMTLAFVLTVMLMMSLLCISLTAAEAGIADNVIFVKDGGTGDGSSPDSPLKATTHKNYSSSVSAPENYLNTELYQAAERLAKTGGTIVICGPVTLSTDRLYGSGYEFIFPTSEKICITSKYNGVDYRDTNGAILKTAGCFIQNAEMLWENIDIQMLANQSRRNIACNGYKTVFGEGINCSTLTNSSNTVYLPSICGSARYGSASGDTDITIKSGSWHCIAGSIFDISYNDRGYLYTGNVNITFDGGSAAYITGSSRNDSGNVRNNGNVNITVNGGTVGEIHGTSMGGFGTQSNSYEVKVTINGGEFTGSNPVLKSTGSTLYTDSKGYYYASSYKLDIENTSSVDMTELTNVMRSANSSGWTITNPARPDTITNLVVQTNPQKPSAVWENDIIETVGASLSVDFELSDMSDNNVSITSDRERCFTVECDTSSPGEKTAVYKYGGVEYYRTTVNVLDAPTVEIQGVQLRTKETDVLQSVRYLANYTNTLSDGVSIIDFGVIAMESKYLSDSGKLNFKDTRGMHELRNSTGYADVLETGNRVNFGCVHRDLPQNSFNRDYTARAFVELSYEGETYYRYSDTIVRNPYTVAKEAIGGDIETQTTKANLKTNVIDAYDNYSVNTQYVTDAEITQLRSKVVEYMRAQGQIEWTPKETFILYNVGNPDFYGVYVKGVKYYGMPYTNNISSNYESFTDVIENGQYTGEVIPYGGSLTGAVSDARSFIDGLSNAEKEAAKENYKNFPGSDCSGAVIYAWNQVINNRIEVSNLRWTEFMIPHDGNATIPVGNYTYDYSKYGTNTLSAVKDIGSTVIYDGYSKLQPGDAIVTYSGAGHTRLVTGVSGSTVTCIDQGSYPVGGISGASSPSFTGIASTANGNTTIREKSYTFSELYSAGYLPITIPELTTGHSDAEFTYVTDLNLDADLSEGKLSGIAGSNRQILSVSIEYKNESGSVVYSNETYLLDEGDDHLSKYDLSKLDMSTLSLESGNKYKFSMSVRVAGEVGGVNVSLIKDYEFTKK